MAVTTFQYTKSILAALANDKKKKRKEFKKALAERKAAERSPKKASLRYSGKKR